MAQDNNDWAGCLFVLGALFVGGYWLYENYEIKEKAQPASVLPIPAKAADAPPKRPTGLRYITELEKGSVWYLNADSVKGPPAARMAWVKYDHSKDKTVTDRESQVLYRLNCMTGAYRMLSLLNYDQQGKITKRWTEKELGSEDAYAPPDSNAAALAKMACDPIFEMTESPSVK